jgi:hypothetical protein
VTTL